MQALLRDPGLSPGELNRVDMILLLDTGWSPPPHRRSLELPCQDRATGAQALPGGTPLQSAPSPPWFSLQPSPQAADHGRPRPALGAGVYLDLLPIGRGPGGAGHPSRYQADSQVPPEDGGRLEADQAQPRPQTGCQAGGTCPRSTRRAQEKAAAGRLVLTYLDKCGFSLSLRVTYS